MGNEQKNSDSPSDPQSKTSEILDEAQAKLKVTQSEFESKLDEFDTRAKSARAKYNSSKVAPANPDSKESESARGLGHGLQIAYALAGTPIVFYGIGRLIASSTGQDQWTNWLTIIGALLGFGYVIFVTQKLNSR